MLEVCFVVDLVLLVSCELCWCNGNVALGSAPALRPEVISHTGAC